MGETDYIECHGTGTPVGDPIEVQAVSRVFSEHRQERLLIGAVSCHFYLILSADILSNQMNSSIIQSQLPLSL